MNEWGQLIQSLRDGQEGRWPDEELHFEFGPCDVSIAMVGFEKRSATCEIMVKVRSAQFGAFLECCRCKRSDRDALFPKIRQSNASLLRPGVLGQALLSVSFSGRSGNLDDGLVVVEGDYHAGHPLNPVGYTTNTGRQFADFLEHIRDCLMQPDGVFCAHQRTGFLMSDLGQFDPFYGYIWAALVAQKDRHECHEGLIENLFEAQLRGKTNAELREIIDIIYDECMVDRMRLQA